VEGEFGLLFSEGRHTLEYRFRKKDGEHCWVSDELRLIHDKSGETDEVVGSWSDITDRKAAEEAVGATRAHGEQLLASSPAVIYSFKASGDFRPTFVSQNIKDWLGYAQSDYLDSPDFWRRRVHPDDLPRVERGVRPIVRNRPPHFRVPVSEEGRRLLLGQRRAAPDL
jgi:PAS domain-containing protein